MTAYFNKKVCEFKTEREEKSSSNLVLGNIISQIVTFDPWSKTIVNEKLSIVGNTYIPPRILNNSFQEISPPKKENVFGQQKQNLQFSGENAKG